MPPLQREYQTYKNGHAHGDLLYPVFMSKKHPKYSCRYKILSGGRDAAKTIAITRFLIERIMTNTDPGPLITGFIRGNLKDTKTSCAIVARNWIHTLKLRSHFHIPDAMDSPIIGPRGSIIHMIGANEQTAEGIKSFEGLKIIVLEEAQYISETAWEIITPTLRQEDSEIWINYNPRFPTDPVSTFVESTKGDPAVFYIHLTYRDNKFTTSATETERRLAKKRMSQSDYDHHWEGKYKTPNEEETLIPYDWLNSCFLPFPEMWARFGEDAQKKNHHTGTDLGISRDGDGNTHIRRVGPFLLKGYRWAGRPLYRSAARVKRLNAPFDVTQEYYDPIGVGAEYSSYRPEARPIFKNGEVAGKEMLFASGIYNEDHFLNRGSQLGWVLRMRAQNTHEKFIQGLTGIKLEDCLFIAPDVCMTPIEKANLLAQISQPLWDTDNRGEKIHIEKEPDGRPSPNYYDAAVYAFAADSTLGLKEGRILTLKQRDHAYAVI